MAVKQPRVPKYRHHKATGQGFVEIGGHRRYLGRHDLPETREKYHRAIAEWLASGKNETAPPSQILVRELVARFWTHAQEYYRRADGTVTKEPMCCREAFKPLVALYGSTKAADFGPLALKAVRQQMIDNGWCRSNINKMISRVRRLFRWATENELVDPSVYHGLQAVSGLRWGRCGAREGTPVKPVTDAVVNETIAHTTPTIGTMVRLQRMTGMRPGEVCQLRVCDLDMSGKVWIFKPASHKTQCHGKTRLILIGPRAQTVLRPFLTTDMQACIFSPARSEQERRAALSVARTTPMSCGNRPGTNVKRQPKKTPGNRYSTASYAHAIRSACNAAWPVPEGLSTDEAKEWRREHHWGPNRLRHSFATDIRKSDGLEVVQVLLGHSTANVTQIYAERDLSKALEVVLRVG